MGRLDSMRGIRPPQGEGVAKTVPFVVVLCQPPPWGAGQQVRRRPDETCLVTSVCERWVTSTLIL